MAEKKKIERYDAVTVFDVIVDATAKYLRAIFPPIFFITRKNTSTEDRGEDKQSPTPAPR